MSSRLPARWVGLLINLATIGLGFILLFPLAPLGGNIITILLAIVLLTKELVNVAEIKMMKIRFLLNSLILPLGLLFLYHIISAILPK